MNDEILLPAMIDQALAPVDFVRLVLIYNPLDAAEREIAELDWAEEKTLAAYLEGLPEEIEWTIFLNDKNVSERSEWVAHYPQPGDIIAVAPVPQRDFGSILAIVATIALAIAAPYAGAAFATAIGMAGSATAAAVGSALFSIAGGLLISAIMPKPSTPRIDNQSDSPTYGIDGPKNTATEGLPVPVVFGKRRVAGNIVNFYTENDTDAEGLSIQRAYMQFAVSEGPIKSLSNFEINNQPIANFDSIQTAITLGTDNQGINPWFTNTVNLYNVGSEVEITSDIYVTLDEVQQVRLDFVAPQGLMRVSGSRRNAQTIELQILIRPFGSGAAWEGFQDGANISTIYRITDRSRSPVRRSFYSKALPLGRYEISWRRLNSPSTSLDIIDSLNIADVGEILNYSSALINTATVSLKFDVTGEFSSQPNVTALCEGVVMPIYDARGNVVRNDWSDNPADVALCLHLNTRFGASEKPSRIDYPKFAEWRAFCEANNLRANIVYDATSDIESALREIYRVGRAQEVRSGGRISISIDRAEDPTMVFGSGNMEQESFELNYLSFQDRVNEIEVQFFDENDGYKRRFVKVVDEEALLRGDPQKPATYTHLAETNYERAYRDALFQLESNKRLVRTARWRSPLEAVTCLPGDVVLVQHEMPSWSEGGRLEAGSTSTNVILDREIVDWGLFPQRRLLVVHDSIVRASGTVANQVSDTIFATGIPGSIGRVRRISFSGISGDFAVLDVAAAGEPRQLLLEARAANFTLTGRTFTLSDVDVIEERNVTAWNPSTRTVVLDSPFSTAPAQFSKYLFGRIGLNGKPFRIQAVLIDDDTHCEIRAIEYREELYSDLSQIPPPLEYAVTPFISHVRDLQAIQEVDRTLNLLRSLIVVTWREPQNGEYAGAIIEKRVNGGSWEFVANARGNVNRAEFEVAQGDLIFVRVRAYDRNNIFAPEGGAPQAFVQVVATTAPLAAPVNFAAQGGFLSVNVSVNPHPDPEVVWQLFRSNTAGPIPTTPFREFVGTTLTIEPLPANQENFFWLRAKHPDGRFSSVVGPISATPRLIQAIDIQNEILDATKFASGLEPVGIIETGPVPSVKTTEVIYHVPTAKLHRWNGSAYIATVPTTDLTGQVTTAQIADAAITMAKFSSGNRPIETVSALPTSGNVAGRVVYLTTDGKLYRHTGSPSGSAGFTAVIPATDISGQIIDAQIAAMAAAKLTGQIVNTQIADGAVTDAKVAALAASKITGQLTDAQVAALSAAKITGQITSTQITDGAISAPKIAASAVTANSIAANSVIADKIAANAVTAVKIAAGAVEAGKIAANAVTAATIAAGAVEAGKIAANAVTANEIAANAVTAVKIAAGSVEAGKIAAGAVTAVSIAASAVTSDKIAANAVTANQIAANSITAVKIAANAITAEKIEASAVTADKIAANSITASKLVLSSTDNIYPDFNCLDSAFYEASSGGITLEGNSLGTIGTRFLRTSNLASAVTVTTGWFPIDSSSNFLASGAVWPGVTGSTTRLELEFGTIDSFGVISPTRRVLVRENAVVSSARSSVNVQSTSTERRARFVATKLANAATSDLRAGGFVLTRRASAELIVDGAITAVKLAANSVTSDKIEAGAITAGKITTGAVTATQIAANAVTAEKIVANAIVGDKIAANAVTTDKIAANSVTADKISVTSLSAISGNLGSIVVGSANIQDASIGTLKIAGQAVDTNRLSANAVTDFYSASFNSYNAAVFNGFDTLVARLSLNAGLLILTRFRFVLRAQVTNGDRCILSAWAGGVNFFFQEFDMGFPDNAIFADVTIGNQTFLQNGGFFDIYLRKSTDPFSGRAVILQDWDVSWVTFKR